MPIANPGEYKVHFATYNGEDEPLDVFVRDEMEWRKWNEYKKKNHNDFSRDYIFSLINFYPEEDRWLFGGAFSVTDRKPEEYTIKEIEEYAPFVGRLIIKYDRGPNPGRGRAFYFENHYEKLEVSQILKAKYSGETFPGYDHIHMDFRQLKSAFSQKRTDWKTALENIEAVYAITDKTTGKAYVGIAHGKKGLWGRWKQYIDRRRAYGHGGTTELTRLIEEHGWDYAENFMFSILEYRLLRQNHQDIHSRERHWKRVLMTKQFGLNRN